MVNVRSYMSGRPFYYTAGSILAVATTTSYIVQEVVGHLAVRTSFEFGKFCKNQTSDRIIPELANITCNTLASSNIRNAVVGITFMVLTGTALIGTACAFWQAHSVKKQGTPETMNLQDEGDGL